MRRFWLGVCMLVILLLSGSLLWWSMARVHGNIGDLLTQAQAAAEAENWQRAHAYTRQAQAQWEKYHRFTAAFADHTPMDEMDGTFAELEVYLRHREAPHFQATCARLILLTQAMGDSHGIQWWNVL